MVGYLYEIKGYVDVGLKNLDGYTTGNAVYESLRAKIIAPLDDATSAFNKDATMGLLEKVLLGKQDHVSISRLSKKLNKIKKNGNNITRHDGYAFTKESSNSKNS